MRDAAKLVAVVAVYLLAWQSGCLGARALSAFGQQPVPRLGCAPY